MPHASIWFNCLKVHSQRRNEQLEAANSNNSALSFSLSLYFRKKKPSYRPFRTCSTTPSGSSRSSWTRFCTMVRWWKSSGRSRSISGSWCANCNLGCGTATSPPTNTSVKRRWPRNTETWATLPDEWSVTFCCWETSSRWPISFIKCSKCWVNGTQETSCLRWIRPLRASQVQNLTPLAFPL